jgi:hypothetical protein
MAELAEDFIKESEGDFVALWEIAQASREDLGAINANQAMELSLELVKRLFDRGLRPGDYGGGDFAYWPDKGSQAVLDRIEREWVEAGHDPDPVRPICWFERPQK